MVPGREGGSRGSVRELPQWHTREGEGVRRCRVGRGKLIAPAELFAMFLADPGKAMGCSTQIVVIH